jgi:predicted nucleic acid-binding protein
VLAALLDANAIWSGAVRDTLLRAAERDLYRPLWTTQILREMAHALKSRRSHLDPSRIDRTVQRMLEAFPDAVIEGYEQLIPEMQNDEADRHVLAAAIHGRASVIVTWNARHFPPRARDPFGIDLQSPDVFLCHLLDSDRDAMWKILAEQSAHLTNPPMTMREVLKTLRKSVPRFAEIAQLVLNFGE